LWRGRILVELLRHAARHAEIGDATHTHFVNKNVFEFQVGMNEPHLLVEVSNAANNLAEHCTGVVKWKSGMSVTFKDIIEGACRAEKHEEKVGIRGMGKVEEWENVLVG
jgi:hypothetical protein